MSVWEFLWWLSFWVCAAVALWDFIFRPWWRERIRRALDEDFGRPKPSEEGRPPGEGWRRDCRAADLPLLLEGYHLRAQERARPTRIVVDGGAVA